MGWKRFSILQPIAIANHWLQNTSDNWTSRCECFTWSDFCQASKVPNAHFMFYYASSISSKMIEYLSAIYFTDLFAQQRRFEKLWLFFLWSNTPEFHYLCLWLKNLEWMEKACIELNQYYLLKHEGTIFNKKWPHVDPCWTYSQAITSGIY